METVMPTQTQLQTSARKRQRGFRRSGRPYGLVNDVSAMDDTEVTCINLRILGNVQPNQRLYTRGLYFNLSNNSYLPEFLQRWAYRESREHAIARIRKLVGSAETSLDMNNEHCRQLVSDARKGLQCLQDTYSTCATTTAQIQQILFRMDSLLLTEELEELEDTRN